MIREVSAPMVVQMITQGTGSVAAASRIDPEVAAIPRFAERTRTETSGLLAAAMMTVSAAGRKRRSAGGAGAWYAAHSRQQNPANATRPTYNRSCLSAFASFTADAP